MRPAEAMRAKLAEVFAAVESEARGGGAAALDDEMLDGGLRTENGRTFFCLTEAAARRLAEICGTSFFPLRPRREDDLTFNALADALGLPVTHRPLRALWAGLDAETRLRRPYMLSDGSLDAAVVEDGVAQFMVVSSDDLPRIRAVVLPPGAKAEVYDAAVGTPWEDGYLDRIEIGGITFRLPGKILKAWGLLKSDVDAGTLDGLRAARMVKDGKVDYFLHRDDAQKFVDNYVYSGMRRDTTVFKRRHPGHADPMPDLLTFPAACLALDSVKHGSKSFTDAWRQCIEFWKTGSPAAFHGFEIRGHALDESADFVIEKSSLVNFGKVAGIIEIEMALADDPALPRTSRVTLQQFLVALGGETGSCEDACLAFVELERSWEETGTASFRKTEFPDAGREPGRRHFTLGRHDVRPLARLIGHTVGGKPPKGRARFYDVRRLLGIVGHEPLLDLIWGHLEDSIRRSRRPMMLGDGEALSGREERTVPFRAKELTVAIEDVERIGRHLIALRRKIPEWTPDYVKETQIRNRINSSVVHKVFEYAWHLLQEAAEAGRLNGIRAGKMRKRNSIRFFIHVDDLDKFRNHFFPLAAAELRAEKERARDERIRGRLDRRARRGRAVPEGKTGTRHLEADDGVDPQP